MDVDGGGWTLALKIDSSSNRFAFSSDDWTSNSVINSGQVLLDEKQAKLSSFATVPVEEVLLGFALPGTASPADFTFLHLPLPSSSSSSSLQSLFSTADDLEIVDGPPASEWIAIHPDIRILAGCRRVFVNSRPVTSDERLRLGLMASLGSDCREARTSIGVGHGNVIAGADNLDNNDRRMTAALLVRSSDLTAVGAFASCADVAAAGFRRTADYLVGDTRTRCDLP
jgi:hypothetical protein